MGKLAQFFRDQGISLPVQQEQAMLALDVEFDALQSQTTMLEAQCLKLFREIDPLKHAVEALQEDQCPFCLRTTGILGGIKLDENFSQVWLERGSYECSNCGKRYEKVLDV